MKTLTLVRHAKTPFNEKGLIQGRLDVELSEAGLAEAAGLKEQLANEQFDKAYTSELKRAKRTAEIVLEGRGMELICDGRINEIDQGEWTGKPGRVLYEKLERYRTWATRPMDAHPPAGETFLEVAQRALSFLLDVQGDRPLVVAHGGIIAVLRAVAGEAPLEKAWTLLPKNAEVIKLDIPPPEKLMDTASILAV